MITYLSVRTTGGIVINFGTMSGKLSLLLPRFESFWVLCIFEEGQDLAEISFRHGDVSTASVVDCRDVALS